MGLPAKRMVNERMAEAGAEGAGRGGAGGGALTPQTTLTSHLDPRSGGQ